MSEATAVGLEDAGQDTPDNAPEVSVRTTSTLLLYFERTYGAQRLRSLWERHDLSLSLDYLRTHANYISLRFLERLSALLMQESGDPRFMRNAGLFLAAPEAMGFAYYLLRAFGSPRMCYVKTIELAPSYNRVGTFKVELLDRKQLRLAYTSKVPESNRDICELRMGQFASIPTIWGLPSAEVRESECQVLGAPVCRYHLTWTDPPSLWGHHMGLVLGTVCGLGASAMGLGNPMFCVASLAATGFAVGGWLDGRREMRGKDEALRAQDQAITGSLSELQQRYDEIFRANVALEDRVAERTLALKDANGKLETALARQQELDRLKSEFFDNVSHELRTPLTLILLALESLEHQGKESEPQVVEHHVATMQRSAQRLLRLINNLLELAQLESGKARLRYQPLELHAFLRTVLPPFNAMADRQAVWLRLEGSAVTPVEVDHERIDIVFQNLLSNALKFTVMGGVTVRVREEEHDVVVEVEDTGPGIATQDLQVIFDRFAQADNSGTRRFGGTGIGLALVKETLELHEGGIAVTSELGKGSIFRVRLPKGRAHIREELRERRRADMPVRRERRGSGSFPSLESGSQESPGVVVQARDHAGPDPDSPRILVVEDDAEIRAFIAGLLKQHYQVLEAVNGEEGRQRAIVERPDLIVSDVMMPVMSGLQMLAALRMHPVAVDIPVILLTARQEVSAKVEALGSGANDYLGKPFSPRELLARIETQLRLREAAVRAAENERLAAVGLLSSGFAHEVRNPLNGLMNALLPLKEVLSGSSPDAEVSRAMVEVVEECGQRIRHLAESLLSFTRGSDTPVSLALDEMLDSTLSVLTWRVPGGVTVERSYECTAPVQGDPGLLNQVWLNLLDNALRAVGERGWVRVSTARDGDEAVITISDNGEGIRKEDMERLFQPFFSTRAAGEGTGLGLALSRRIVVRHGGRIQLSSEPGQGTQVEVRLPLGTPAHASGEAARPDGEPRVGRWA
ncbi:HAMP domain-containing histidine kinase [Myxococcus sp. K15C18031901]|uniref:sensor histidine kinase n=1 Tax=Myxococcus dinghuensis TaxID=2906761 RepID=UPI0020A82ED7|nr:HAMP domain-containing sensor histidine kinase [Myxococcus dinghuensis]MCP3103226.1 HAMP domain-containing histidine kinase [Myxococcus dinghuensis]